MSLLVEIRYKLEITNKDSNLMGCNEAEISALKRCQCITYLPFIYTEFLSELGQNAGQFLKNWNVEYEWLLTAKQEVISRYFNKFKVEKDIFVFGGSDRKFTNFLYFETNKKTNDPAIYMYDSASSEVNLYYDNLSDFYISEFEKLNLKLDS